MEEWEVLKFFRICDLNIVFCLVCKFYNYNYDLGEGGWYVQKNLEIFGLGK